MVLKGQPGEQALETSVSAPPTVIVERLITVMVVFVYSFCIVFYVFVLCLGFYEEMRVEDFLRSQWELPFWRLYFMISEWSYHHFWGLLYCIFQWVFILCLQVELNNLKKFTSASNQRFYLYRWRINSYHSDIDFQLESKCRKFPLDIFPSLFFVKG